mgnify:CR=1 FL=1
MQEQLDERGLYDIYSIWYKPFWQTKPFYLIIGICTLLLILLLAWKLYRWFVSFSPSVPSWKKALKKLDTLGKKEINTKEDGKHVYFALTDCLKTYLHKRYGLLVKDKTDQELVAYLQVQDIPSSVVETIEKIGEGALLIKFANQEAVKEQVAHDIQLGVTMVNKTIPEKK